MPDPEPTWQPLSALPMIAAMIMEMLHDAQEQYATLKEAEEKPHVLDDAIVHRVIRVHTDQLGRQAQPCEILRYAWYRFQNISAIVLVGKYPDWASCRLLSASATLLSFDPRYPPDFSR